MNRPDIQHLIMQDLKFKMSAWRAIAIIALLLFSGVFLGYLSAQKLNSKALKLS